MKGRRVHSRLIILCVSSIVLMVGIVKLHRYLFTATRFVFSIDPLITHSIQETIISFAKSMHQEHASMKTMSDSIANEFPFIRSISVQRIPVRSVYLELKAYDPLCVINNDTLLLYNEMVIPKQQYLTYFVKNLPHITLQKNNTISSVLKTVLKKIVMESYYSAFLNYNVTWINENEVWLCDKKQEDFSILGSINRLPTSAILNQCAYLKSRLSERNAFLNKKKKPQRWIADIRFDKQIVLYKNLGG